MSDRNAEFADAEIRQLREELDAVRRERWTSLMTTRAEAARLREELDAVKRELEAVKRREAAKTEALQLCYDESQPWAGESSDMGLIAESRALRLIHSASEAALAPDAGSYTAAADAAGERLSQMSPKERKELKAFALNQGKTFTREQLLPVVQALQLVWDAVTLNEGDGPADLDASMIFKAMCRLGAIGLLDAPLP